MVYHGTPDATFDVFHPEQYFADKADVASIYTGKSASSIASSAKDGNAPAVYPVYLKIERPFDTRIPAIRKMFEQEFYNKYGTGTPLSDKGLPDWNDARDLAEWIKETGKHFDGLILDEGGLPQTDGSVKSRGLSYVPLDGGAQVKSAIGNNGNFDGSNPNILYSRTAKGTPTLIIQHNLTEENLLHADRMGGIPVPSLAITQAEHPLEHFGNITLVGGSNMADPKGYAATKVFGADIYSPRYPKTTYGFTANMRSRGEGMLKDGLKATNSYIDWGEVAKDGADELRRSPAILSLIHI